VGENPRARRVHEDDITEEEQRAAGRHEYRSPWQRDRDRILYSSALRRLTGITQVAAPAEVRLLHNRLSHSLKVAQVGRRLAEKLLAASEASVVGETGGIDTDVVEAAGLAHDLGHPPFGHIGEAKLNALLLDYGGFEGNAQTFRILTRLSAYREGMRGLDLTLATLNAVLKHPRPRPSAAEGTTEEDYVVRREEQKWGVYETEKRDFDEARKLWNGSEEVSPEAAIMDLADDITYALHDIEDFYQGGLIPLHRLRGVGMAEQEEREAFLARAIARLTKKGMDEDRVRRSFQAVFRDIEFDRPYRATRSDRERLRRFVSTHITSWFQKVTLSVDPPYLRVPGDVRYEIAVLKELTWYYVIDAAPLATVQVGHRKIIEELFTTLESWVRDDLSHPRIPHHLRELVEDMREDLGDSTRNADLAVARSVGDFVAGLTEAQALDLHQRLTGASPASIFGVWF